MSAELEIPVWRIICIAVLNPLRRSQNGNIAEIHFYIILIIVIYLVGRGIYEGQINETTTVGEVVSDVGQGTKEIVKRALTQP